MQAAASSTSIAMDTLIYPRQGAARLEEVHCTWTHPTPYLQTVVLRVWLAAGASQFGTTPTSVPKAAFTFSSRAKCGRC